MLIGLAPRYNMTENLSPIRKLVTKASVSKHSTACYNDRLLPSVRLFWGEKSVYRSLGLVL
jgi:hypothetical protein